MKKIIPLLVVFLFLFSLTVIADAPIPPYAVDGKASLETGECIAGFNVYLETINYKTLQFEEISTVVNQNCEYQFSLGNPPFVMWMEGMEIHLRFCTADKCKKTIKIGQGGCEKGGGCTVNFELSPTDKVTKTTEDGDEEVSAGDTIIYVCWDGSKVSDTDDCPEKPKDEEKDIYDYLYILAGVILSALGLTGFIKGLVPYWYNRGVKLIREGKVYKDKEMIEQGKKCKARAIKMMTTAMRKAAEGKYGK